MTSDAKKMEDNVTPIEDAKTEPQAASQEAGQVDKLMRALADAENRIKRAEREKEEGQKFAVSAFARDVLTVADNLRRALETVNKAEVEANASLKNIMTGVEFTEKELLKALERHGVKKVEPAVGDAFDYNRHQAMFEVETSDHQPGKIVQVLQAGYVIADRLLRPALVGVAKAPNGTPQKLDTVA